ncbi:hypothetical protein B0T10DRAFT_457963 [Thelonectria olida]|uniref:3'-5' exonuclease domain-containing protein n=1 Tax=Thelonectria olida TaxID=1576542 RepID=A0A9P8W740_9HYPO|nr:hypothetical protein B0T10DRAFT_457963 [Thelonectria olida]
MSAQPRSNLWDPSSGIRFSARTNAPKTNVQLLYPSLDTTRYLHTANPGTAATANNTPAINLNLDEFSDDDQFERDATQWCDENEILLTGAPPIKGAASVPVSEVTPKTIPNLPDQTKAKEKSEIQAKKEPEKPILPPVSHLEYVISNDLFQAALKRRTGTPQSYWSHTMYRRLHEDGTAQNVKVHYCTSKHTMEDVCKKYFIGEEILGFDMEWMMYATSTEGVRRNISLIQIASPSRIALFHTARFPKADFVAPTFREIMENEDVIKTGVNISGDCTRLKRFLGVQTKGIFELSHLYKLVKYSRTGQLNFINKVVVPMSTQVQEFLRLPMYKGEIVRQGNWMQPLNSAQIQYSASDAYAGIHLYHVMDYERQKLDPCPPLPELYEKRLPIKVAQAPEVEEEEEEEIEVPNDETMSDSEDKEVSDAKTLQSPDSEPALISKPETLPSKGGKVATTPPSQGTRTVDPRIIAAELKKRLYISRKRSKMSVLPTALRSYYIWYENKDLQPDAIAKILRDPPLKTNTVVSYILDSIAYEGMPYSKQRLKTEVLSFFASNAAVKDRYKALFQAVEDI